MEYQVTLQKVITLSVFVEASDEEAAIIAGRETILEDDETAFVEESHYTPARAYPMEYPTMVEERN